jgi:hypothetical protein
MAAPPGSSQKRALSFPKWVEAGLIVFFLVTAVLEFLHDQWMWAGIFGVAGSLFGASLVARMLTGDDDGRE